MENSLRRSGKPSQPIAPRGVPATGRIAKLMVGQGHGVIRSRNDREVFFHRSDLGEGTTFNDLRVGDVVAFELLDDQVSGARALRLERRSTKKPRSNAAGASL
jgi:cold shock CspA family protein